MTPVAWIRWAIKLALVLGGLLVLYVAVTFAQVWWTSRDDQARSVDAIVVLGAAQYDGRPSPVLEARLEHALELYQEGLAEAVVVTGGKQAGDRFTEAFSGYEWLRSRGVPEEALFLEIDGTNTFEELSASALILESEGLSSALLVSDPYHSKRLLAIAGEVGMDDAYVSPTDTHLSVVSLARETAAVSVGRIVGYRRLGNWL